jgi:DsbC/DsbD-like thiol-disulfide interchange protein
MLFLGAASHFAHAGGKSDTKVKAKVTATKPDKDGKQTVTITLDIEQPWYIYANPTNANKVAEDIVAVNRTNVSFKAKGKVDAQVKYPVGKVKTELIGTEEGRWNIYQDHVTVVAEVRRAPGDESALEAVIEVNACKIEKGRTGTCLPQGKIMLKVP